MRGRVANDLDEQLDILELFKLEAEEAGVWRAVDPYLEWKSYLNQELSKLPERTQNFIVANAIRDYERGLIYTPQEAIARSFSYRNAYANLVITCGPSGSGKSTLLSEAYPDHVVVSLDTVREELTGRREDQSQNGQVIQVAKERLRDCLRNHRNVVWDATSLIRTQRAGVAQLGFNYQAEVTLVVFHMAESVIERHNRQRPHPVPAEVLGKQLSHLDFPYLDEAHRTLYAS